MWLMRWSNLRGVNALPTSSSANRRARAGTFCCTAQSSTAFLTKCEKRRCKSYRWTDLSRQLPTRRTVEEVTNESAPQTFAQLSAFCIGARGVGRVERMAFARIERRGTTYYFGELRFG